MSNMRHLKGGELLVDRFGFTWKLLAPIWEHYAWVVPYLCGQYDGVPPQSLDCDVAMFRVVPGGETHE